MPQRPVKTEAPADSRIRALLPGASFHDAWSIASDEVGRSALEHFLTAARRTPRWIELCMAARNRAARLVGLKDLGALSALAPGRPADDYQPGERIGIFTLREQSFDEALVGDSDRHLDVVMGVHRQPSADGRQVIVTVTTVVHVRNLLGRLYMLPVAPMHRLIAPAVLAAIAAPDHATITP